MRRNTRCKIAACLEAGTAQRRLRFLFQPQGGDRKTADGLMLIGGRRGLEASERLCRLGRFG